MKMEPVSVKFKPNAVKPKGAYIAREPPVHWLPAAKKLIEDLLKDAIIEEMDDVTEFCLRARFLPKDNNVDLRLVTDFHGINGMLLRPVYLFESTKNHIKNIPSNHVWFAALDMIQGYFQVPLDEETSNLIVFYNPMGKVQVSTCSHGVSPNFGLV